MTREEQWLLEEKYDGANGVAFEKDRERLTAGEPLGYIIGWQPFLRLKIFLDSRPLIPRPETEWWTEQLIAVMRKSENISKSDNAFRFLDLCAGSGAIGSAVLARLSSNAYVSFGEIDPVYGPTILKNIRENGLDETRADIRIGDLFEPFDGAIFDVIAANPPYIPTGRLLSRSVVDHEPALALFSGSDGLDIIRRIATELPSRLAPDGIAWIECDSEHGEAARALFEGYGFHTEIRTDQYGVPRIIVVSFT